jgi:gamma-glutamylcyclotransferase (GGCT)/AIG2-like uncharacterized protein YtfP
MTTTRFFVYGSLCEGMVHFSKIQNFIESSIPAQLRGTAYRLKVGFPAIVNAGTDIIPGFLVDLKSTDFLINLLDEFFGYNPTDPAKSLYHRQESIVSIDGGGLEKAWVYFLNPQKLPPTATVIQGGDWRKSLTDAPALTEKLTEKQKCYISKLGGSSGRDIVPIDLQLYRELMNLELIVDKGRRLALSKLGHEVYRHLS